MAVANVSEELWELVEPLLPRRERSRPGGRSRHPDRQTLSGVLFVLHTGIAWRHLPQELGFGSGVTCWRRLDEWQRAGVLGTAAPIDVGTVTRRGSDRLGACRRRFESCASEKRGEATGSSPVDRGRLGSKHHLIVDQTGIPLAFSLTGGNRHDVTQLVPLVDQIPPLAGPGRSPAPPPGSARR